MVAFPIWRLFFLLLSISAFYFIFYEDSQYKPFGFRYWLGLAACIWLNFVTLVSYFIAFTGGSIMVYNRVEQPMVLLFIFVLCHLAFYRCMRLKPSSDEPNIIYR